MLVILYTLYVLLLLLYLHCMQVLVSPVLCVLSVSDWEAGPLSWEEPRRWVSVCTGVGVCGVCVCVLWLIECLTPLCVLWLIECLTPLCVFSSDELHWAMRRMIPTNAAQEGI